MKIIRDEALEVTLLDSMRQSFEDRSMDEVHVSDLMTPRRAYWSRVAPRPLTDDEVGYYVAGRGHEDAVGRISGLTTGEPLTYDGISGRPDFRYAEVPVEMKTRRRNLATSEEEAQDKYDWYWRQLLDYKALEWLVSGGLERSVLDDDPSTEGYLWVLGLVSERPDTGAGSRLRTRPEWQCWRVTFTAEEIADAAKRLVDRRDRLLLAWDRFREHGQAAGPHRELPLCPSWQCGEVNRVQTQPPRCETCERDFQGEWGAKRHVESKGGAGHVVSPPTYRYDYTPKCRWYDVCQPGLDDPARQASDPVPEVAGEEVPF